MIDKTLDAVERIGALLGADPVCGGRVMTATIEAIAAMIPTAIEAHEALRGEGGLSIGELSEKYPYLNHSGQRPSSPVAAGEGLIEALRHVRSDWAARKSAAEWAGRAVAHVDDILLGLITYYAALPATSPAAVGEGWMLVPIEPSDAMFEAAAQAWKGNLSTYWAREMWDAMLEAARPTPPSSEEEMGE